MQQVAQQVCRIGEEEGGSRGCVTRFGWEGGVVCWPQQRAAPHQPKLPVGGGRRRCTYMQGGEGRGAGGRSAAMWERGKGQLAPPDAATATTPWEAPCCWRGCSSGTCCKGCHTCRSPQAGKPPRRQRWGRVGPWLAGSRRGLAEAPARPQAVHMMCGIAAGVCASPCVAGVWRRAVGCTCPVVVGACRAAAGGGRRRLPLEGWRAVRLRVIVCWAAAVSRGPLLYNEIPSTQVCVRAAVEPAVVCCQGRPGMDFRGGSCSAGSRPAADAPGCMACSVAGVTVLPGLHPQPPPKRARRC